MSDDDKPIPRDEWETIVRNVPLVSVDLVVKHEGGVLLGKRQNEPAKGEWFVPGGVVLKNESLTEAVQRVARDEIGCEVSIKRSLDTFEHFYNTSEIPEIDTKHYLANGFVVTPDGEPSVGDDQHEAFEIFHEPYPDLHKYVERYLNELE